MVAEQLSGGWILTRGLRPLEQFAVAHGLDWASLCNQFDIDPKLGYDAEVRMPIATLFAISDHVSREAGNDAMGFAIGSSIPVGFSSTMDYVVVTAPSLRTGLQNLVRFQRLSSNVLSYLYEEHDGSGYFSWRCPERFRPKRQYLYGTASVIARRVQYVTGDPGADFQIQLSVPAPRTMTEFQQEMGARMIFDRTHDQIVIPSRYLDMSHELAEPNLYKMVEETAVKELSESEGVNDFLFSVSEAIVEAMRNGTCTLEGVAKSLSMSPRTLQRQLTAGGTSFRSLVQDIRRTMAEHYLSDTEVPLNEIAFLLGFGDLSAFSRSAKNWFGLAPGQFRLSKRFGGVSGQI